MRITLGLILILSTSLFAEERAFKKVGGSPEKADEAEQVETFTATLEGRNQLVFSAIEPPKTFATCTTVKELEGEVAKRFLVEKQGPKLGKSQDRAIPTLEFWLEGKNDAPDTFAGMSIPDEMLAMSLCMRVTATINEKPVTLLEGKSVWWGAPSECAGGVKQATTALLDRFFQSYREANPLKTKK